MPYYAAAIALVSPVLADQMYADASRCILNGGDNELFFLGWPFGANQYLNSAASVGSYWTVNQIRNPRPWLELHNVTNHVQAQYFRLAR